MVMVKIFIEYILCHPGIKLSHGFMCAAIHCRCASFSNLSVMSTKADTAFSTEGFCNWKKALTCFKTHEFSRAHKDALSAYTVSKNVPISLQLQKQLNEASEKLKQSLFNQLRVLRTLLRQGLSVRNDHTGGSNLTVILDQVLDECAWIKEGKIPVTLDSK